jgi:Uncharacterized conserved protein
MYDKLAVGQKVEILDGRLELLKENNEPEVIGDIYTADTFFKRFMGYMFRKKPHHSAIFFSPCNSIHCFFMRFDIDVIFLNERMEIIRIDKAVKPWKVIMPIKGAVAVIEVPSDKA